MILLVIGINHVPLLKILQTTGIDSGFGAFLAFLSLFAGSALGFLVSQFWWWKYEREGAHFGIDALVEEGGSLHILIEELGLVDLRKTPKKMTQRKKEVLAVYDYISAQAADKFKDLGARATRRWDMYHLLSPTMYTVWIGWLVGIAFRFYYWIFLFGASFSIYCNAGFWAEFLAQSFILIVVVVLACLLYSGTRQTIVYYADISKIRFRRLFSEMKDKKEMGEIEKVRKDLREIFPSIFR